MTGLLCSHAQCAKPLWHMLSSCKTVNFFRFFVILVQILPNFAHLLNKKKFLLKINFINFEYFCRFYGRRRNSFHCKYHADPAAQAIAKATVPKKS